MEIALSHTHTGAHTHTWAHTHTCAHTPALLIFKCFKSQRQVFVTVISHFSLTPLLPSSVPLHLPSLLPPSHTTFPHHAGDWLTAPCTGLRSDSSFSKSVQMDDICSCHCPFFSIRIISFQIWYFQSFLLYPTYDLFTEFDFPLVFMPVLWQQPSLKALFLGFPSVYPFTLTNYSEHGISRKPWGNYLKFVTNVYLNFDFIRIWWSKVISQTLFVPKHKNSDTHFAQMSHRMEWGIKWRLFISKCQR